MDAGCRSTVVVVPDIARAVSRGEGRLARAEPVAAQAAGWAPIRHHDTLQDRASYRYFWQVLERAHRTSYAGGPQLPAEVRRTYFDDNT